MQEKRLATLQLQLTAEVEYYKVCGSWVIKESAVGVSGFSRGCRLAQEVCQ